MSTNLNLDQLSINNIRVLCSEMIDKAKSGHPGMAIGAAPIMHTLFTRFLNATPSNPEWFNRDYFVLSGGHASSLLYTILHLSGYPISMDDLKAFRSLGSITPGHPELGVTPGVDATTGPLGQGIGEAVGIALAEEHLREKTNGLVNHYTYALCGDGDIQEGISQEAFSVAGFLNLSKLIVLYDSNDVQLDGDVNKCFNENNKLKFEALGWNYQLVKDGNDCEEIARAIKKAQKANKPSLIEVKTIIGHGTKNQGTSKVHGAPLPHDEVVEMREKLGTESFTIPAEVYDYYKNTFTARGNKAYKKWLKQCKESDTTLIDNILNDSFISDFDSILPTFDETYNNPTRKAGGELLKAIANNNAAVIGGSADLASSCMAQGVDGDFNVENRLGRHINYGVREHAMGAITNGLAIHKLRAFASTFFAFVDYLKPAIRMSGLSHLPAVYIFSHDSIAVGEDGPTHHPIEQLTMLRSIPNVDVIRPADANETKETYKIAFTKKDSPTCIVLSRQVLPTFLKEDQIQVSKGAYIVSDSEKAIPDGILLASGSELSVTLEAKELLKQEGLDIRVVSIPSTTLFDKQSKEYKEQILPSCVSKKMAVEMSEGAHYYKYVGCEGLVYGINKFGVSASGPVLIKEYGYTKEKIAEAFKTL